MTEAILYSAGISSRPFSKNYRKAGSLHSEHKPAQERTDGPAKQLGKPRNCRADQHELDGEERLAQHVVLVACWFSPIGQADKEGVAASAKGRRSLSMRDVDQLDSSFRTMRAVVRAARCCRATVRFLVGFGAECSEPHGGAVRSGAGVFCFFGDDVPSKVRDADYWLDRAEEAQLQAEEMTYPPAKREMLLVAARYRRLAQHAQQRISGSNDQLSARIASVLNIRKRGKSAC